MRTRKFFSCCEGTRCSLGGGRMARTGKKSSSLNPLRAANPNPDITHACCNCGTKHAWTLVRCRTTPNPSSRPEQSSQNLAEAPSVAKPPNTLHCSIAEIRNITKPTSCPPNSVSRLPQPGSQRTSSATNHTRHRLRQSEDEGDSLSPTASLAKPSRVTVPPTSSPRLVR